MCEPITLAIGSFLASSVGSVIQGNQTAKAAAAQADANNASLAAAYAENSRQMEEVNRVSTEQKHDRTRAANKELSTIRATANELGVSNATAFVVEAGYNEGVDKGRLESNRKAEIARINAASQSGYITTRASNQQLAAKADNARTGSFLSLVDSGLTLGSDIDAINRGTT